MRRVICRSWTADALLNEKARAKEDPEYYLYTQLTRIRHVNNIEELVIKCPAGMLEKLSEVQTPEWVPAKTQFRVQMLSKNVMRCISKGHIRVARVESISTKVSIISVLSGLLVTDPGIEDAEPRNRSQIGRFVDCQRSFATPADRHHVELETSLGRISNYERVVRADQT